MAKTISKKVGRPSLKVRDRLGKNFTIRFRFDEFRQLKQDAKGAKMTIAQYLRYCWKKAREE